MNSNPNNVNVPAVNVSACIYVVKALTFKGAIPPEFCQMFLFASIITPLAYIPAISTSLLPDIYK